MPETPYFVSYPEAIKILESHPLPLSTEVVPLDEAHNRILSHDLESKVDDPRFDNSSMDGFAFRYQDSLTPPTHLSIIHTLQAGAEPSPLCVEKGQAVRIMTRSTNTRWC